MTESENTYSSYSRGYEEGFKAAKEGASIFTLDEWKPGDQVLLTGPEWDDVYPGDLERVRTISEVFPTGPGEEREGEGEQCVTFTDDRDVEWVLEDEGSDWGVRKINIEFDDLVRNVLFEVGSLLIQKNASYGNSALDPVRIFSKADPVEQLKVRIDDKLGRLMRGNNEFDEDTVLDLIGYLTLLRVAQQS